MNSNLQNLQAAKSLLTQLLVRVNLVIANPTQANIDAAITAINEGALSGQLAAKPDYSLDGESYNWNAYKDSLIKNIADLNQLIQAESMPWMVRSRSRP